MKKQTDTKNKEMKVIEFSEETKIQIEEITYKLKSIFASPITDEKCNIIMDSIIFDYFSVDDNISELEAIIWHINMFLEQLAYSFLRGGIHE